MTDREKLKKLFTELGIGFTEDENRIACEQGNGKIKGYSGFFTDFSFDGDGKFIEMGVWE